MASIDFQDNGDGSNPIIAFSLRGLIEEGGLGENETADTAPYDDVEIVYSTNRPLFYISVILNLLTFIGCILSAIFVTKFRNHRSIRMAQPFFLFAICLASAFIALSGIILEGLGFLGSYKTSNQHRLDILCSVFAFFFFGDNTIVYMALFVKTWRLQRVTRLRRNQTVKCYHVLWPLILADCLGSIVFVTWMVVARPVWEIVSVEEEIIDEDGNEKIVSRSVGYCDFTAHDKPIFVILMLFLMDTSVILGYWMSRKIPASVPEELNDGKQMKLVYVIHGVILFVFCFIYFLGRHFLIPNLMGIVTLFLVFPFAFTNIAVLIAPKCHAVYYDKADGVGTGTVVVAGLNTSTSATNGGSNVPARNTTDIQNNGNLTDDVER